MKFNLHGHSSPDWTSQFMYNKLYIYFYDLYSPVASFFLCVCVCVCALVERERATMNKQYVALPRIQPGRERTRGGLFRTVTSPMPGKFHFNLLIFGCPVGGGGGGGGGNSARPAVVLQILLSVFFWYCMEVMDPNLGGIVQYVTRKLNSTCVLVLLFIFKLHFLNTTVIVSLIGQYGVYIPRVHTVGG